MKQAGESMRNNQAEIATRIRLNQEKLAAELKGQFDFIVCGAGISGSVVAGRLAANPAVKVLLLEAGGTDELELVINPNHWVRSLGGELDWGFIAEPNPHLNGRAIPYSMGKVLGGGSSINVGTWSRGHQVDWDAYAAEARDSSWGYEAVLKLYRDRIEDWTGAPDPKNRGTAKMGRDAMSVVDGWLKVYGVEGLRVADASILPRVTTGNTMAPCVVVGERAVDILQKEHSV
jgi:choline dehydrogenase-like flavoprotein